MRSLGTAQDTVITSFEALTPAKMVELLDRYIIGQAEAKRAIAVAVRNRYRRQRLKDPKLKEEIIPKNILMIGPTGVGKTEIARRMAKLIRAPFVKVEATKYTEVGYVGRDVESMVRDLVEASIRLVQSEKLKAVERRAFQLAVEKLLDVLVPESVPKSEDKPLMGMLIPFSVSADRSGSSTGECPSEALEKRAQMREKLLRGELDDMYVEIEIEQQRSGLDYIMTPYGPEQLTAEFQEMLSAFLPRKIKRRRLKVREALEVLKTEEARKLIDFDEVKREAIERAEQLGIIFIDEIDKIAHRSSGAGPDVSREGVQRDLLPIVEGTTVLTKYGPVKTDYILFIAAGAFHVSKVTDLIPELQGRFPIRVKLKPLTKDDFYKILKYTDNSLIKQYAALLETEGVKLRFLDEAIERIAEIAEIVNMQTENIGARRLHTILEKLLEDISFEAPSMAGTEVVIDAKYVDQKLKEVLEVEDKSSIYII